MSAIAFDYKTSPLRSYNITRDSSGTEVSESYYTFEEDGRSIFYITWKDKGVNFAHVWVGEKATELEFFEKTVDMWVDLKKNRIPNFYRDTSFNMLNQNKKFINENTVFINKIKESLNISGSGKVYICHSYPPIFNFLEYLYEKKILQRDKYVTLDKRLMEIRGMFEKQKYTPSVSFNPTTQSELRYVEPFTYVAKNGSTNYQFVHFRDSIPGEAAGKLYALNSRPFNEAFTNSKHKFVYNLPVHSTKEEEEKDSSESKNEDSFISRSNAGTSRGEMQIEGKSSDTNDSDIMDKVKKGRYIEPYRRDYFGRFFFPVYPMCMTHLFQYIFDYDFCVFTATFIQTKDSENRVQFNNNVVVVKNDVLQSNPDIVVEVKETKNGTKVNTIPIEAFKTEQAEYTSTYENKSHITNTELNAEAKTYMNNWADETIVTADKCLVAWAAIIKYSNYESENATHIIEEIDALIADGVFQSQVKQKIITPEICADSNLYLCPHESVDLQVFSNINMTFPCPKAIAYTQLYTAMESGIHKNEKDSPRRKWVNEDTMTTVLQELYRDTIEQREWANIQSNIEELVQIEFLKLCREKNYGEVTDDDVYDECLDDYDKLYTRFTKHIPAVKFRDEYCMKKWKEETIDDSTAKTLKEAMKKMQEELIDYESTLKYNPEELDGKATLIKNSLSHPRLILYKLIRHDPLTREETQVLTTFCYAEEQTSADKCAKKIIKYALRDTGLFKSDKLSSAQKYTYIFKTMFVRQAVLESYGTKEDRLSALLNLISKKTPDLETVKTLVKTAFEADFEFNGFYENAQNGGSYVVSIGENYSPAYTTVKNYPWLHTKKSIKDIFSEQQSLEYAINTAALESKPIVGDGDFDEDDITDTSDDEEDDDKAATQTVHIGWDVNESLLNNLYHFLMVKADPETDDDSIIDDDESDDDGAASDDGAMNSDDDESDYDGTASDDGAMNSDDDESDYDGTANIDDGDGDGATDDDKMDEDSNEDHIQSFYDALKLISSLSENRYVEVEDHWLTDEFYQNALAGYKGAIERADKDGGVSLLRDIVTNCVYAKTEANVSPIDYFRNKRNEDGLLDGATEFTNYIIAIYNIMLKIFSADNDSKYYISPRGNEDIMTGLFKEITKYSNKCKELRLNSHESESDESVDDLSSSKIETEYTDLNAIIEKNLGFVCRISVSYLFLKSIYMLLNEYIFDYFEVMSMLDMMPDDKFGEDGFLPRILHLMASTKLSFGTGMRIFTQKAIIFPNGDDPYNIKTLDKQIGCSFDHYTWTEPKSAELYHRQLLNNLKITEIYYRLHASIAPQQTHIINLLHHIVELRLENSMVNNISFKQEVKITDKYYIIFDYNNIIHNTNECATKLMKYMNEQCKDLLNILDGDDSKVVMQGVVDSLFPKESDVPKASDWEFIVLSKLFARCFENDPSMVFLKYENTRIFSTLIVVARLFFLLQRNKNRDHVKYQSGWLVSVAPIIVKLHTFALETNINNLKIRARAPKTKNPTQEEPQPGKKKKPN